MSMDIRHFKSGFVTVTAYANITAALNAVVHQGTNAAGHVDEFPNGDGFIYNDINRRRVDIYLTSSQGSGTGTIYRVRLIPETA